VGLATHMLAEEAKFRWMNSRRRLEAGGIALTLEMFQEKFLRKNFPVDVRRKKGIEFLELKQGSLFVAEYATKFAELSWFCSYINEVGAEASKCIKFESGLHPKINQYVGFHEIWEFASW